MPARAFDDVAHQHVQAQILGIGARLLAAGEFDQVVHQQRQLADLLDHVGQQALAFVGLHVLRLLQDLDVRAQAGDGRAQLVRGVGDELALRVNGGVERAHRALERVEHRVEARRQAPDLVVTCELDPPAEVLCERDVLGGLGEALQWQHGGAGDQPPEQRRKRDAADVEQREDQAQAAEQVVDFGELLGDLNRAPGRDVLGEDAHVQAVDLGVREGPLALVERQRPGAGVDRQRDVAGGPEQDVTMAVDELLIAAHLAGSRRQVAQRGDALRRRGALRCRGALRRRLVRILPVDQIQQRAAASYAWGCARRTSGCRRGCSAARRPGCAAGGR